MNPRSGKSKTAGGTPPPSPHRKPSRHPRRKSSGHPVPNDAVSAEERHQMIAEAAYYLAESQGFADTDPVENWLRAESQIDAALRDGGWNPDDTGTDEDIERT